MMAAVRWSLELLGRSLSQLSPSDTHVTLDDAAASDSGRIYLAAELTWRQRWLPLFFRSPVLWLDWNQDLAVIHVSNATHAGLSRGLDPEHCPASTMEERSRIPRGDLEGDYEPTDCLAKFRAFAAAHQLVSTGKLPTTLTYRRVT